MEKNDRVDVSLTIETRAKESKDLTYIQLLNFCLGFFGLQFAWQMRMILSGPVTENLGADPTIFGLIWLAGPFTGIVVQPLIGSFSDKTHTKFGRRRPFILGGALLASIALLAFPNSANIVNLVFSLFGLKVPALGGLLFAAIMIWIIDACVNIAQGPYRALIPDTMPENQHALANSFLSFAIGLGSVVAAGTAPFLSYVFNYQMSISAQFIMAALAFSLATIWTCINIKENISSIKSENIKPEESNKNFLENLSDFFKLSPQVGKICWMQFFTWIGVMCMFIFFTQFTVHILYNVPDLSGLTESVKKGFEAQQLKGTNLSSIGFAVFNLVCFLVSLPIGILASKFGNKNVHACALISMSLSFLCAAFIKSKVMIMLLMAIAGIGWSSILALPFAMLSKYIKPGTEGTVMGIFNIFIAGPQIFVCTLVAWFIATQSYKMSNDYINYHWEYIFIIGSIALLIAALVSLGIDDKKKMVE